MKPMPASWMQWPIWSGVRSILTPKAANTSAAPERDESARLPCLATGTPAPATMSAAQVEMLNEPEASPPVPTTSMASGGALTRSILARIADTAPVISSPVSPPTRSAIKSAPICDGVASPAIICSKAVAASSRPSAAPVATFPIKALNSTVTVPPSRASPRFLRRVLGQRCAPSGRRIPHRGDVEKVLQHQVAMVRGNAFRMKLHAVHRQLGVCQAHDDAGIGIRCHGEVARQAFALDHERVIARRLERRVDAAKNAAAVMADFRQLAVDECRRAHHLAAEGVADRLVAEADAEDRDCRSGARDQIETDAGLFGRAGAGRQHDRIGVGGDDVVACHLVVAMHLDLRPELTEIVDEVEGEAVIVIDQNEHGTTVERAGSKNALSARLLDGGRRRVKAAYFGRMQRRSRLADPAAKDDTKEETS